MAFVALALAAIFRPSDLEMCLVVCMELLHTEISTKGHVVARMLPEHDESPSSIDSNCCYFGEIWDFPKNTGTLFWGPYGKDPTIEGAADFFSLAQYPKGTKR